MQPGDVKSTFAETKELEKWTNFKPKTDIKTGVERFIKWYLDFYKINKKSKQNKKQVERFSGQRAESSEQRTASSEQRAASSEQRAANNEQREANSQQRAARGAGSRGRRP